MQGCFSWLFAPNAVQLQDHACALVVDPITTGAVLAAELSRRGYTVVAVWSTDLSEDLKCAHLPETARDVKYHAEIDEQQTICGTAAAVRAAVAGLQLRACLVGAETGVRLADALSQELGLHTNGTTLNRRSKHVQQQCLKAAGMRAVREVMGTEWSEVKAFVDVETLPVVVKPVESAGSEGVKLCKTKREVQEHFHLLMGAQLKLGSCAAVLVQEYLQGTEYVVDHVSRDGVHKTVMVWYYDKRPCNGADFVYFGMLPVSPDSAVAKVLISYTREVLDAIEFKNGPSHGEIMMTESGPCLVEMNARSHGGDGHWIPLVRAVTGYSQVDATIDAFLDDKAYAAIPDVPPSPKASGLEVCLVCYKVGTVTGTPGFDKIRQMKSCYNFMSDVKVGSRTELSVDLFTSLGSAFLIHEDPEVLAADIDAIRKMEADGTMLEFEEDQHVSQKEWPTKVANTEPIPQQILSSLGA